MGVYTEIDKDVKAGDKYKWFNREKPRISLELFDRMLREQIFNSTLDTYFSNKVEVKRQEREKPKVRGDIED